MRKYDDYEALVEEVNLTDDEEQGVEIDSYSGRWSAFEKIILEDATYYIYEHDTYGDATCYLVGEFYDDCMVEVYETYDNLIQCLIDEDIIIIDY